MLHLYILPAFFALFTWWLSTGLIMYLDGLPRSTFRWSMLGATVLFGVSLWGLAASSTEVTVRAAYCAFTCGLLAWGWQEISFYMGYVTGPRGAPCPEGCRGWRHFGHAIQTSLWHELAIIAAGAVVVGLTWHAPNQVGTWTFMVLWWMHQSAKLNVFLGVRNLNEEFLPEHLQFLRAFLTKKSMNLLFPISITVSMVIMVLLVQAAVAANATAFEAAGFTFLATMMGLAIVEHWLLMLPLPGTALWSWSLKSRKAGSPFDIEVVAGFLGAGKTTFLRNAMATQDSGTVVLVNDFSSVGLDGSLLRERGAEVVELPNGCICCSLKKDLATQLKSIVTQFAPKRVLIEPSGVADLASLLGALSAPEMKPLVRSLHVTTVLDAGAFLRDYARMTSHIEAQARLATVLVINKTDLVAPATVAMIATTIRSLNPSAQLMQSTYGIAAPLAVQAVVAPAVPQAAPTPQHDDHDDHDRHHHGHDHGHDHDHGHGHGHGHGHDAAFGFDSWNGALVGAVATARLADVLDDVTTGAYGRIERLKGIARAGGGWIRFDVAGGRASMSAFAAPNDEAARVIAIGHDLQGTRLQAAFDACAAKTDTDTPQEQAA